MNLFLNSLALRGALFWGSMSNWCEQLFQSTKLIVGRRSRCKIVDGVDAQGNNASPAHVLWFWMRVATPLAFHRQKSVQHSAVTSFYIV